MDRRTLLTVAVAGLLLCAGCATTGGGDGGGPDGAADAGAVGGASGPPERAGDGGDGASGRGSGSGSGSGSEGSADRRSVSSGQSQTGRAIVRTGTVRLRIAEFDAARSAITDRATAMNGYVAGSGSTRHTRDNESWTTGYVVVRVPSQRFGEMLSFVRDSGTVLDEETETKDVTDRLVDLEARLTNLRERRDRLRSFYDRANSTQELLSIEEKLSAVQSDIEKLKAEKRALEDRVDYATLRVELREPEPTADDSRGASLVGAIVESSLALVDRAYGLALFAARLAPYAVALGIPALVVGVVLRRRLGRVVPWSRDRRSGRGEPRVRSGEGLPDDRAVTGPDTDAARSSRDSEPDEES